MQLIASYFWLDKLPLEKALCLVLCISKICVREKKPFQFCCWYDAILIALFCRSTNMFHEENQTAEGDDPSNSLLSLCSEIVPNKLNRAALVKYLPRLVALFLRDVEILLGSDSFYLSSKNQNVLLSLMSLAIQADVCRDSITAIVSSIFRSILMNKDAWEVILFVNLCENTLF